MSKTYKYANTYECLSIMLSIAHSPAKTDTSNAIVHSKSNKTIKLSLVNLSHSRNLIQVLVYQMQWFQSSKKRIMYRIY